MTYASDNDLIAELVAACRPIAAANDTYEDSDTGETYRTCCHANYRFYPFDTSNPHAPDCATMKMADVLARIDRSESE